MPKQNITCSVCGTINDYDSRFCKSCIAPLNVKKLNDFDYDDYKLLFDGFLKSIEGLVQTRSYNFNFPIIKDYLNAFWLRPETALYLASEYICLQKILVLPITRVF